MKYLQAVQRDNVTAVNEAINGIYLAEENYKALRESIDTYSSFDQFSLAVQLEKHELLEFRRIAAYLLKNNKKYERSIEISKKDKLWGDAMECAAESKEPLQAEKLLYFFVDNNEKECFAACLYTCYDLIRPDVVLECAWRHSLMSYAMPFMIQSFRELDDKLVAINARLDTLDKADKENKDKPTEAMPVFAPPGHSPPLLTHLGSTNMYPPTLGPPGMAAGGFPQPGYGGGLPPLGGMGGGLPY